MFLNRGGSPVPLASIAVNGERARLPGGTRQQQAARRRVPGEARRRKAGGHDEGRRAHGQFRRRAAAEVAGEQRQRARTSTARRSSSSTGTTCRRLRLPGGQLPHHVEGRRRRAHQRTADAQPGLEAEVLELPPAGRVQARREEQQRHLPPRPLRDAGPRRTTASQPKSTATWPCTRGRRRSSTPASPRANGRSVDIVIVGNRVTATLNGQKVQDNTEIQAITGGALDADETEPGPILIQGDHTKVWFKKITVTPIL